MIDNYSSWPRSAAEAQQGWPGSRRPDRLESAAALAMMRGEDPVLAMGAEIERGHRERVLTAALDGERSLARTRQTKAARLIREAMDVLGIDLEDLEEVQEAAEDDGSSDGGEVAGAAGGVE